MRGPGSHSFTHGSSGLRRMARAKRSIAASGSPSQFFTQPPKLHASAKLELSTSARSIKAAPTSRSRTTNANAYPLAASAIASSLPNSTARWASLFTSAISFAVSEIQPLTLAMT